MKNYILKLILIFPLIIYCTENNNITDNKFPFRKISDMLFSTTVYPTKTKNIKVNRDYGASNVLLVGNKGDFDISILIKFNLETDLKLITEAKMLIFPAAYDDELTEEFEASIYEIISDWDTENIDNLQINPTAVSSYIVNSSKAEPDSIIIPPGLVQKWNNDTTYNKGVMISSNDGNFVKRYYAIGGGGNMSFLKVKGETDSGDERTIEVLPIRDTYIAKSSVQPAPDELVVDDLSVYRTAIRFDTINVPENATINMARLELSFKPDDSFLQGENSDNILGFLITTYTLDADEIEFDSDNITGIQQHIGLTDSNKVYMNITNVVQQWVSDIYENYGLILVSYTEGSGTGKYVFNLNKINQQEPIILKIEYTVIEAEGNF